MDLLEGLDAINQKLKEDGFRLRIEQRGRRLNLRGLLPTCENPDASRVQRLSPGLPATPAGLREAEQTVRLIERQLNRGAFKWQDWRSSKRASRTRTDPRQSKDIAAVIAQFEEAFFADPKRRRSPSGSRTTWTGAYLPYLRRLQAITPEDAIDANSLLKTLSSYEDGSRSRQQCATTLGALASHLELNLPDDWRQEAGGYGLHKAQFRQLPTDQQILETAMRIPNPRWRLAYGLMATYGLRNHEVFFCDYSPLSQGGDRVLRVLPTTKTGEHQSWPFHPDWVESFGLEQLGDNSSALPEISTDLRTTTLQQVGRRVSEQFRRYELPIKPYDLRHAWAVRTIHIGLPDTVAARMMGHSVAIHTRTYHHWITRRDQQQAVDSALSRHRTS